MTNPGLPARPRPRAAVAGLAVLAALALSSCAAEGTAAPSPTASPPIPSSSAPPSSELDDATREALQSAFDEAFGASGMPGAAAYVRIGDEVWESALGVGDLATEEPFDPRARIRIASITKTFTATAVLQLVDQGRISLDDPVAAFVPGITDGDRITVRDLLQMSSGIWEFTADEALMSRWSADLAMPWTWQQTVELIQGKPAQFEPGEKVVYTDSNYVLLGAVLEATTGMDASSAINTMVVEPLRLRDTHFPAAGESGIPQPHQQGYRPPDERLGSLDELEPVGAVNPEVAWTAGAMTSTLADLAAWADALADGELLSSELQAERLQPRRFDGQTIEFGYGLGVIRLNDFIGHDGAIMGYSSVAMRYPEADATFVIIGNASTNSTTPTMDIFLAMVKKLYPDQLR